MSDIHTILQLLQRQPTPGPPAYSTVTSSPDYHRPAVKVQPVSLITSHLFSHTGTQVSLEKAAAFFFHTRTRNWNFYICKSTKPTHESLKERQRSSQKSQVQFTGLFVAGYFSVMM